MSLRQPPFSNSGPPPPTALRAGLIWNLGSLAFLAIAGFLINIVIARAYDESVLGLFNICASLLIAVSQFGVFGLHLSTLQAVSLHAHDDHDWAGRMAWNGLITAIGASAAATLLALALTPLFAGIYQVEGFVTAWLLLLPGLFLFSINKVLYAAVNGAQQMRLFAITQSLRFVLMIAAALSLVHFKVPGPLLTLIFTIAEFALFPVLAFAAIRAVGLRPGWPEIDLMRHHAWFGARVFLSGAILELNARVSVLFLGAQLGAAATGVYTMAVLIQEGVAQAVFVIRNNINPLLAKALARRETGNLLALSRKIALVAWPLFLAAAACAWLVYPFFVDLALADPVFDAAHTPLFILLGLLALAAPLLVFNQLFSQAQRPGVHTGYMATVLATNILLNAILIPLHGLAGAALATGGALVVSAFLLVVLARRLLGVRLVF